jgi:hypothetical protein
LDIKEQRKAVFDIDKKYGINVFSEVVKKGVVSKVYTIGEEDSRSHAVLLEGIDGKAYFIPLLDKPDVKEGQFVKMMPGKSQTGRLTPVFTEANGKHLAVEAARRGYDSNVSRFIRRTEQIKEVDEKMKEGRHEKTAAAPVKRREREGIEI